MGILDYAAIVLTAFHSFLRIGEAFAICRQAICLNAESCGIIQLGWTKGAKRKGAEEFTHVEETCVGRLLLRALTLKSLTEPLLAGSAGGFRRWFEDACCRLGVAHCGFRPYSLRRGGATHHWEVGGNLAKTIERGRWSSVKTARIYLVEASAALLVMNLSPAVVLVLKRFAAVVGTGH